MKLRGWLAVLAWALPAAPSLAQPAPVQVEVLSIEYARESSYAPKDLAPLPGTTVRLLLTHDGNDWRSLDLEQSQVSRFADDRETDFTEGSSPSQRLIASESRISGDGRQAVLAVWAPRLPASGADQLVISGNAVFACGKAEETTVDRTEIRLTGGETYNIQPFRVVTFRPGTGGFAVELRYLKSSARVIAATLNAPGLVLNEAPDVKLEASGEEWVRRSLFPMPPDAKTATLSVRFLPIEKMETVPFEVRNALAFGKITTNPILRWLKRFL